MKAVVAILALVATSAVLYHTMVSNQPREDIGELWSAWKLQHGREYSASEEILRKGIFQANWEMIKTHNADPESSFTMALNKFADLTGEEFKEKTRCMDKGDGDEYCPGNHGCTDLPKTSSTTWDWRKNGAVTAVKNQEQCGSCWAFSTTGSLEGLHYQEKKVLLSFSEQQLVDCAKSCYGCEGCWTSVAMEYTAKKGVTLESVYPYKGVTQTCKIPNNATLYQVNSGFKCVPQKDQDQFLAAIVTQPVSIAVEADQQAWQFYSSGIVKSGCGDALDHAVLAVGFDISGGYYIVKNSWGSDWGESGYIRIGTNTGANGGFGVCGILRCANRPVA